MSLRRNSFSDIVPSFCAVFSIAVAIVLFGADSVGFSLIVSTLVLGLTILCALFIPRMRPPVFIISMFLAWCLFTLASYFLGRIPGYEQHYLMVLSAIAIFWLGYQGAQAPRAMSVVWRLFLFIGLLFSVFAMFQHALMPNEIYGINKPLHKGRLTGTFLSSNTTATFLGMIVIASMAQLYRWWLISFSKSHDSEIKIVIDMIETSTLASATFLFSFVALLLTASRAGVAAKLVACFLFIFWIFFQ